ncbi:MAG: hypothetical protein V8S72_07260 [Oscillospiraceae bacterium]
MDQLPIVIKETNARCSDIGKLMDYLCVILDKFNSDAVENIIGRNVNIGNDSRFATGYTVSGSASRVFQHWKRQFSSVGLVTPHLLLSEYTAAARQVQNGFDFHCNANMENNIFFLLF